MPTRHGWLALIGGVIALVAGRLFGIYELFAIGGALIGVLLVALGTVHLRPVRLTIARRVNPPQVHAGDVARVEIAARNRAAVRTPLVQLHDPVTGSGGARVDLAPFGGRSTASATYRLPTQRRGQLRIGPLMLHRTDVLGLVTTKAPAAPQMVLTVLPRWYRVGVPTAKSAGGALGDHLRQRALGRQGDEFRALRDYVPGDDLRRIHWRASARTDDLVVREMDAAGTRNLGVVLDVGAARHRPESFERAIEIAASIVLSAAEQRVPVQFCTTGGAHFVAGSFTNEDVLSHLATVTPESQSISVVDAVSLLGSKSDGGVLVVVGGAIESGLLPGLRHANGADATIVVECAGPTLHGQRVGGVFVVDGTSAPAFVATWQRLMSPNAGGVDVAQEATMGGAR